MPGDSGDTCWSATKRSAGSVARHRPPCDRGSSGDCGGPGRPGGALTEAAAVVEDIEGVAFAYDGRAWGGDFPVVGLGAVGDENGAIGHAVPLPAVTAADELHVLRAGLVVVAEHVHDIGHADEQAAMDRYGDVVELGEGVAVAFVGEHHFLTGRPALEVRALQDSGGADVAHHFLVAILGAAVGEVFGEAFRPDEARRVVAFAFVDQHRLGPVDAIFGTWRYGGRSGFDCRGSGGG